MRNRLPRPRRSRPRHRCAHATDWPSVRTACCRHRFRPGPERSRPARALPPFPHRRRNRSPGDARPDRLRRDGWRRAGARPCRFRPTPARLPPRRSHRASVQADRPPNHTHLPLRPDRPRAGIQYRRTGLPREPDPRLPYRGLAAVRNHRTARLRRARHPQPALPESAAGAPAAWDHGRHRDRASRPKTAQPVRRLRRILPCRSGLKAEPQMMLASGSTSSRM